MTFSQFSDRFTESYQYIPEIIETPKLNKSRYSAQVMSIMICNSDNIDAFVRYVFSDRTEQWQNQRIANWKSDISNGTRYYSQYYLVQSNQTVLAGAFLNRAHSTELHLIFPKQVTQSTATIPSVFLQTMVEEVVDTFKNDANYKHYQFLDTRIPHCKGIDRQKLDLKKYGFKLVETRVEFKCEVEKLPSDQDTPFHWQTVYGGHDPLLSDAAKLLVFAGDGNSEWSDYASNRAQLKEYLHNSEFPLTPYTVNLGYLGQELAAIIITQVDSKEGWCTIAYMGLSPKFRQRGLGKWVQRRGFHAFKALSGTLYHGGTSLDNQPMVALFEKHGCKRFQTMDEYRLARPTASAKKPEIARSVYF